VVIQPSPPPPPQRRRTGAHVGVALANGSTREHVDTLLSRPRRHGLRHVTGIALWHYHRLIESMEMSDVDLAWLPPILAARAAWPDDPA
jgi:hypothetical protein